MSNIDSFLKKRVDLVWIGTVFGLVYWVWQSFRDSMVLQKSTFLNSLIFPDIMSLAVRLVVICVFLLFCIHAKYLQEKLLEDKSPRNRSMGIIAFVISAIGFIMLYWIVDSFQDILSQAKGDIVQRILTPGLSVLISRFLSVLFLVILVFLIQYLFTSRKKAEKALKTAHDQLARSRENLNKIVTNDVDAVFVISKLGQILFVNPAAERMFQKPVYEMINTPFNYHILKDKLQEIEIINEVGETIITESYAVDIEWENEKAVLITLSDISERKNMEKIRQHFLSLISHRLKSPIVGVCGAIENMLEGLTGNLSDKQREYLLVMRDNVTTKYHLIEDLLTALRLEAGGEVAQIEPVVLVDILQNVIKKNKSQIQSKGLQIESEKMDPKLIVKADPKKLEKTIQNIIHNAMKFTSEGTITVETRHDESNAIITIEDTGRGMSDTTLKSLFSIEKKMQTLADATIGMGFGLYIAKKFMLLQNGDVKAESALGKGTKMTIVVPLKN